MKPQNNTMKPQNNTNGLTEEEKKARKREANRLWKLNHPEKVLEQRRRYNERRRLANRAKNSPGALLPTNPSTNQPSCEMDQVLRHSASVCVSGRSVKIRRNPSALHPVKGVAACHAVPLIDPAIVFTALEGRMMKSGIPLSGIMWRRDNESIIDSACSSMIKWLSEKHNHLDLLGDDIVASKEHPVKCPVCGRMDNDWEPRIGLCCECWCRELDLRIGSSVLSRRM